MRNLYDRRYRLLLQRLRHARRQAGLTQDQVAAAVGKPQSFVSKCEAGERRIDAIELLDFARLYSLPLAFFVSEGTGPAGASLSSEATPSRSGETKRRRAPVRTRRRRA